MAIVKLNSTVFGFTGATGYQTPNSAARDGFIHRIAGSVSCAATDNAGSTYKICDLPSSAILLPQTLIKYDGWGFAQTVLGIQGAADGLLDALTSGGSANGNAIIGGFGAAWNKPVWTQAGLTEDPMHPLSLIVTAEADAAGAGDLLFEIWLANHI